LSDILLDGLHCRNVLGHLILPGSELFHAAPRGIEIGRQRLKLSRWVK
jgi:hypothetical protein